MRVLVDGLDTLIEGEVIGGELLDARAGNLIWNPSLQCFATVASVSPFTAGWWI